MPFSRGRVTSFVVVSLMCLPAGAVAAPPVDQPPPRGGSLAPSERFSWPVTPHVVMRRFDAPDVRWGPGHRGVDLAAAPGTTVRAPSAGTVTFVGSVAERGVLTLRHPEGFDTTYEPIAAKVKRGDRVERGQVIGVITTGGHCEARCLHWGYRVSKDVYRDPLTLIGGVRPILLPPT